MEGIKMFRQEDSIVVCKKCHSVVSIGYNILQEKEFEDFASECKSKSICPSCLKKERIGNIINNEDILLETAKNMIAVGII